MPLGVSAERGLKIRAPTCVTHWHFFPHWTLTGSRMHTHYNTAHKTARFMYTVHAHKKIPNLFPFHTHSYTQTRAHTLTKELTVLMGKVKKRLWNREERK